MKIKLIPIVPIVLPIFLYQCGAMPTIPNLYNLHPSLLTQDTVPLERNTFNRINDYRNSQGLPDLIADNLLTARAKYHSQEQASLGRIYHLDLSRYSHPDLQRGLAENVALNSYSNTVETAVTGWINSPGHTANILNPNYTHTGIGVVESNGVYYYTQIFGY